MVIVIIRNYVGEESQNILGIVLHLVVLSAVSLLSFTWLIFQLLNLTLKIEG